jgi:hypothetical protein
MDGVDIPYPHRFDLGAAFPILLDVTLDLVTGRKDGDPSEELRIFYEVTQGTSTNSWIMERLSPENAVFLLGIPVSAIGLIHAGIAIFSHWITSLLNQPPPPSISDVTCFFEYFMSGDMK